MLANMYFLEIQKHYLNRGSIMELVEAISMFGYTVVFGIIGLILYSAFQNNKKNRRKGDK